MGRCSKQKEVGIFKTYLSCGIPHPGMLWMREVGDGINYGNIGL